MERLDRQVVHEICANQAVVTLHACVKELIENALDAGATRIDVRLKESGAECVEVADNGSGIAPENFEKLAARHATSKIKSFDDIHSTLNTFGFRGEALSAICTLGELSVCTKTTAEETATLLKYDRFGAISERSPAAREIGTTVTVCSLFKALPVRHREFLRNLKQQVSNTIKLLQSYAIGMSSVRFHVTTERASGRGAQGNRTAVITTSGTGQTWRPATAAVLGSSSVADVLDFQVDSQESGWRVVGLISSPMGGRRSKDNQLFWVNRRPVDPPKKIVKLINDTYHAFNSRMWPAIILDFTASQTLVDVNVTPDKRTVLLQNEAALLKDMQERLVEMFTPHAPVEKTLSDFGIRAKTAEETVAQEGKDSDTADAKEEFETERKELVASEQAQEFETEAKELVASEQAQTDQTQPTPEVAVQPSSDSNAKNSSVHITEFAPKRAAPETSVEVGQKLGTGSSSNSGSLRIAEFSPKKAPRVSKDVSVAEFLARNNSKEAPVSSSRPETVSSVSVAEFVPQTTPVSKFAPDSVGSSVSVSERLPKSNSAESGHVSVAEFVPQTTTGSPSVSEFLPKSKSKESRQLSVAELFPKVASTDPENNGGSTQHSSKVIDLAATTSSSASSGDLKDDVQKEQTQKLASASTPEDGSSLKVLEVVNQTDLLCQEVLPMGSSPKKRLRLSINPWCLQGTNCLTLGCSCRPQAASQGDALVDDLIGSIAATHAKDEEDSQPQEDSQSKEDLQVELLEAPNIAAKVSIAGLKEAAARRKRKESESTSSSSTAGQAGMQFPKAFSLANLQAQQSSLQEVANLAPTNLAIDQKEFAQMQVIGQFNLGFIIAALPGPDSSKQLFIVDQHASDEKTRFEDLNRNSKIDKQTLVCPHHLELSPAQEQVAVSHLEVLKLNGFDVQHDEQRPPGKRLRLTTLPVCQNLVFSEKDLIDLITALEEGGGSEADVNADSSKGLLDLGQHRSLWGPGTVPRPPKIWALLASRACRGAIMIGKALRPADMERVLSNLSSLEQPWNCPHGRPTMRHLVDSTSLTHEVSCAPPLQG